MNARAVIGGLCLGLFYGTAFGQQTLVAHGIAESLSGPLPVAFSKPDPGVISYVLNLAVAPAEPPTRFSRHDPEVAIGSASTHESIVELARNFVPGQPPLDAAFYVPLTGRQKWDLFLHNSNSAGQFTGVSFDSLISQATGAYPSFGGGMGGYYKRFGVSLAGAESASFFGGFLFPALLHQDPRYFPSQSHHISDRLAYAVSRVFITRSDAGRNVINTSLIASDFVEAAVANAYIPYRHPCVAGTLENGLAALEWAAESNILDEFGPDMKAFLVRHQPKSLRRWHKKQDSRSSEQLAP